MGICVSCRRRDRKGPLKRAPPAKRVAVDLLPRRTPLMANSISNIQMANPLKVIVSKRRKRYTKDGFNLDLAYITERLIAMGFPAEKLEGVYRNHIDEVARFLEEKHRDHYRIYNLCSERSYDSSKFHDRVVRYAFDDHNPPNIELIIPFCEDVHSWLSADSRNVAAVHCKAGKGRTGTMVSCYLLYSGQMGSADEALQFYGTKRTHDEKGVTIPSQRRYVEYYSALLRSGLSYSATAHKVHIRELIMSPPLSLNGGQCTIELTVIQLAPPLKVPAGCQEIRKHPHQTRVVLTQCTPLCGDVKVEVYTKPKMMRKEKLFHFWFNTFFVANCVGAARIAPPADSMELETFKLTLNKWQLDIAHKDKQHKQCASDFKVELIVQKQPESSTFCAHSGRAPSPPTSSDSSCSEPDTEPDGHWDSGERYLGQPCQCQLDTYHSRNSQYTRVATNDCQKGQCHIDTLDTCQSHLDTCRHRVSNDCQKDYKLSDGQTRVYKCCECIGDSYKDRDSSAKDNCHIGHSKGRESDESLCDRKKDVQPYQRFEPGSCHVDKCQTVDEKCSKRLGRDTPTKGFRDSPTKGFSSPTKEYYEDSSSDYLPMCFTKNNDKTAAKSDTKRSESSDRHHVKCKEKGVKKDLSKDSSCKTKKMSSNVSPTLVTDKDNYTKICVKKVNEDYTKIRPKLSGVKSKSAEEYSTFKVSGNPSEPIYADKDNYTTLRSVKKSNKQHYLVCDSPEETRRVCSETLASYVNRLDPASLGYSRIRDSDEENAKMYAETVADSSGVEYIRFSDTKQLSDESEIVFRSKSNTGTTGFSKSGPASFTEDLTNQPENSKTKKKCPKRDEDKASDKGKIPKVASDHTISDDTKKKHTFFHRREKDEESSRPRLSLGDMRASWREFSGKWAEHRRKKDRDDS